MKRWLVFFAMSALLVTLVSSIGFGDDNPKYGGDLRIAINGSPPTLDWQKTDTLLAQYICSHIFEELTVYDEKFGIIPQLAERWEVSQDKSAYTFYLRSGVMFHNGEKLTANDVKASIERFKSVSIRAAALKNVVAVEVLDPLKLRIVLSEPDGFFLNTLGDMLIPVAIYPASVIAAEKAGAELKLVGTGPYKFVEWIPEQYIHLTRFQDYQADQRYVPGEDRGFGGYRVAYIDNLYFVPVSDEGARVAGLQAGEYDWIDDVPMPTSGQLATDPAMEVGYVNPNAFLTSYVNMSLPPTDNLTFRRAVQIGIDMEKICAIVGEGTYSLFPDFWDPSSIWGSDAGSIYYNVNDKERARQLLKQAGYDNEPLYVVTNSTYGWLYRLGVALADELQQIGMNTQLRVYDWPTALSVIIDQPENWHFWMTGLVMDTLNPMAYANTVNYSYYTDRPRFAAAYERLKMASPDEYQNIIDTIQLDMYENVPLLHFGGFASAQAWTNKLQDYKIYRIVRFWNSWLTG